MSATMARQGGRVQLAQSDMRPALNMVKIAKGGFWRAAIEQTQHWIKRPRAEVWEQKKPGVGFAGHRKLKIANERHPAMVFENQTDGCLRCQNGTAKNSRTRWRHKGTGAPPQIRRKQPTPELTPPLPGMPPAPSGDKISAQRSEILNLPARYEYKHAPLSGTHVFTHDTYAEDSEHDEDFIPDLRNDDGTSTGWYTICCMVLQLTSILQMTAAN